ncbi:MAG: threonine/serine exporter family protein [Clostridia bacterium]|nr:threonine/serine exporter family protein [Clostridia bacterium]
MSDTLSELLRAFFGAFIGAVGFAMLVHVPKRSWLPSGIIAGLSYLVYWLLTQAGLPDPMGIFIGSLFGSLTGQICARKLKMIGTIFLMSAIVPVVPGLGLYRMMAFLGEGQTTAGVDLGIQAMITIAMIALGTSMGSFIDRIIQHQTVK